VHPNNSINVRGIESLLDVWERDGWIPDVIVIDYADLLLPPNNKVDKRFQIDDTWKQLRGLSQSRHCLVLTATQADASSYRTKILGKSNFSESKTKLGHTTGIVGINVTPAEKEMQVRRLNWIVLRDADYNELECLYIAGCLGICRPMIMSYLPRVHVQYREWKAD
jgi:replicative DNA helicase